MKTTILLSPLSLLLLLSLLAASLFSISAAQTINKAARILSDSGYKSMSLSLDLAADYLDSNPTSVTIFAPSDDAFAAAGQPSLDLLRLHLLHVRFPLRSLKSLPYGAKIDTLLDDGSLTVTTLPSDDDGGAGATVSLNNVTVSGAPIYDDGSLIVYGIERFFSRYFQISTPSRRSSKIRGRLAEEDEGTVTEASRVMRAKGFPAMAAFLELRFLGAPQPQDMTIFVPIDQVMSSRIGDLSQFSSILLRHVVPRRLASSDLASLEDGSVLQTNLQGFTITVSRNGNVSEVNGAPVVLPEIYQNGWLVLHVIGEVLELQQNAKEVTGSPVGPTPTQTPSPPHAQSPPQSQSQAVVGRSAAEIDGMQCPEVCPQRVGWFLELIKWLHAYIDSRFFEMIYVLLCVWAVGETALKGSPLTEWLTRKLGLVPQPQPQQDQSAQV